MDKYTPREKRTECDGGMIVFDNLGFGIDSSTFKKLNNRKDMLDRCSKCEKEQDCNKKSLFALLMQDPEADDQTRFNSGMN